METTDRDGRSSRNAFILSPEGRKPRVKVTAGLGFPEGAGAEKDLFQDSLLTSGNLSPVMA